MGTVTRIRAQYEAEEARRKLEIQWALQESIGATLDEIRIKDEEIKSLVFLREDGTRITFTMRGLGEGVSCFLTIGTHDPVDIGTAG